MAGNPPSRSRSSTCSCDRSGLRATHACHSRLRALYLSNDCGGLPDGRGQGVRQCTSLRSGPGHVGPSSRLDPLPPGVFIYPSLYLYIPRGIYISRAVFINPQRYLYIPRGIYKSPAVFNISPAVFNFDTKRRPRLPSSVGDLSLSIVYTPSLSCLPTIPTFPLEFFIYVRSYLRCSRSVRARLKRSDCRATPSNSQRSENNTVILVLRHSYRISKQRAQLLYATVVWRSLPCSGAMLRQC